MKYFYILIALSISMLFGGCASSMKSADKGLEKVNRKIDSVYESIREFTDPLGLPFTLEPVDPERNYSSYRNDEYAFEHVAGPDEQISEIKGLPAGSIVEVYYQKDGYQFAYTIWEKDGKAKLVVPKEGIMNLHVTVGEIKHMFFNLPTSCHYRWRDYTKELEAKCEEK